jgi:RNA binding exosome subunit
MGDVKLHFRTFVHATEDHERVTQALLWAMAVDEEPEGASRLEPSRVRGHHGNEIRILEAKLGKTKDVTRFVANLRAKAPEVLTTLAAEAPQRLDEDAGVLHFRLDKQRAVDRRFALTGSGDAIQVDVRIARYPGTDLLGTARRLLADGTTNV